MTGVSMNNDGQEGTATMAAHRISSKDTASAVATTMVVGRVTQPSQPVSLSSREEGSDSESSSSFSVSNAAECKIENEVKPSVTDAVNNIRGVVSLGNNGLLHSNSNGRRSTGMVDRNRGMSPCQDSRTQILRRLSEALMRQSLTKIDMSQRGLQSSDAKLLKLALMQNAHLTVLKLGYNYLSDSGILLLSQALQSHTSLETLDVGFNHFGDVGCEALASALRRNPECKINTLYLAGNCIGERGALALATLIRDCSTNNSSCQLARLHLTANKIGDTGVQAITKAVASSSSNLRSNRSINEDRIHCPDIKRFKGMEELFLGGTGIGPSGCKAVADMIATSTSLKVLSLSDNFIGDAEAAMIAKAISSNKESFALESFQLSFNCLTCVGVESLMNSIWGSRTLKSLKLDNNMIRDRGAQLVAVVLTSTNLEVLDIGFNNITSLGMKALMKLVAENKTLKSLTISGNRLDNVGSKAVAFALAYNQSLKSVFIDKCSMGYAAQRQTAAGIVSNSGTSLQIVTGFRLGVIAVSLGFPSSLESWTNEQVLKFIHLMWERMRNEEIENDDMEEVDPLDFLPSSSPTENSGSCPKITGKVGPLDPPTVVAVARKAFASLENAQDEVRSLPSYREPCFESPLVNDDAIMMEVSEDGIMRPIEPIEEFKSNSNTMDDITFSLSDVSSLEYDQKLPRTLQNVDEPNEENPAISGDSKVKSELDPDRKRKNIDWLCRHLRFLNELGNKSFNSVEMWELHQHFFAPVSQLNLQQVNSPCNSSDDDQICDSDSRSNVELMSTHGESNNAVASSLPILRRKESFQLLSDVAAQSYFVPSPSSKQTRSRPISVMIEENTSCQSFQQHRKKRAKRPKAKIAYFPRIKEKLDYLLATDHNKALTFMRQLLYVEKILFTDAVEFSDEGAISKLTGASTLDAELIMIDLM